jgi:predicted HicB family RNase H-like nuclease
MRAALAGMHHGDYVAELVYKESTRLFRGRVINVEGESIYFWGSSIEELHAEFARSVQLYEQSCRAASREPKRPRPVGE